MTKLQSIDCMVLGRLVDSTVNQSIDPVCLFVPVFSPSYRRSYDSCFFFIRVPTSEGAPTPIGSAGF